MIHHFTQNTSAFLQNAARKKRAAQGLPRAAQGDYSDQMPALANAIRNGAVPLVSPLQTISFT